jgi:adenosylhomocysteine nucleosidase
VSLFLDQAIDRGIVVPVTTERDGAVFRAYRHGEDVQFGESEERLSAIMLKDAAVATGRDELPHLWVEKLLVLLIRVGLHKNILNPWVGQPGASGTIGIRYSLHGAVVGANSPKLYEFHRDSGLVNLLREAGVLADGRSSNLYRIERVPTGGCHPATEAEARRLGSLIGRMLAAKAGGPVPRLDDQDLTLLATCLYPNDAAAAIAAEVHIFSQSWRSRLSRYRQLPDSPRELVEAAEELRQHASFTAVNSGLWKFRQFMRRKPWETIEELTGRFEDPVYAQTWRSYWPEAGAETEAALPPALAALIQRQGIWCFRANILLRMIEVAVRYKAESGLAERPLAKDLSSSLIRALTEMSELCASMREFGNTEDWQRTNRSVERLQERVKQRKLDPTRLCAFVQTEVSSLLVESIAILTDVNLIVTAYGRPRRVRRFPHVLHIDLQSLGTSRGDDWREVVAAYREVRVQARKAGERQKGYLEMLDRANGPTPQGRWVCATGSMARVWLVRLAGEVARRVSDRADVRLTLFAHLNDDDQLSRAESSSAHESPYFRERAVEVIEGRLGPQRGVGLTIVTPSDRDSLPAIRAEVAREAGDVFDPDEAAATDELLERPVPLRMSMSRHNLGKFAARVRTMSKPRKQTDVGIITIVTEEVRAVIGQLRKQEGYQRRSGSLSTRQYYEGVLPRAGGGYHSVVCTQALDQGSRSIEPAYHDMGAEYSPRLIVLLGIGGGIHKDAGLCDVVFADQVVYYDKRKVTPEEVRRRGEAYKIEAWLKIHTQAFFVEHREPAVLLAADGSPSNTFKVQQGPIGSGEAVVAFHDASERQWLTDYNDKVLALETEAGGVAQAFYEERVRHGYRAEAYLVVRGISDHADADKDDKWRQPAADNAVIALAKLLAGMPAIGTIVPSR